MIQANPGMAELCRKLGLEQGNQTPAASPVSALQAAGAALAVAVLLRLAFVLRADFPLNDGGLFYSMIEDLRSAGYWLPAFASYNSAGIPFAYPPLAFYLAGATADLTPLTVLDTLRWLPFAANLLTILAVAALARSLLPSRQTATAAVFAFVLLPRSSQWLLMGGGLTRSFGFLCAVLALRQVFLVIARPEKRHIALASLFAALTALSHLEMIWFLAFSSTLFWLAQGRNRAATLRALAAAAGALVLSLPWWAQILRMHGLSPFLAAADQGNSIVFGLLQFLFLSLTGEPVLDVLACLAVLGIAACIVSQEWLLPIWLLVTFLLDARGAQTSGSPAVAMLAGIGFVKVVWPIVGARNDAPRTLAARWSRHAGVFVVSALLVYTGLMSMWTNSSLLEPLSKPERAAMQWVSDSTPEGGSFLVVSGHAWPADKSAEWFPTIAQRRSVATVQGTEWLPGFSRRIEWSDRLRECALRDTSCLEAWSDLTGITWTHVYVPLDRQEARAGAITVDDDRWPVRDSLRRDPGYEVIYDGAGATIFRKVGSN